MNCILIDVGNTSTSIALACNKKIQRRTAMPTQSMNTHTAKKAILKVAHKQQPTDSAICSVVPSATGLWSSSLSKVLGHKPLIITHKLRLNIRVSYPKPSTIGADRLANACGAVTRYGAPVIVADFGTALTFDVITADNAYVGGVIAPGLPMMTHYLAEKTALLPKIQLPGNIARVGKSTRGAMMIGAKIGYRGIVKETVQYLKASLNMRKVTLCATGGYAQWTLQGLNMSFKFDKNLTLFGIRQIYQLNRPQ
jgi:type III pantothenate kinase